MSKMRWNEQTNCSSYNYKISVIVLKILIKRRKEIFYANKVNKERRERNKNFTNENREKFQRKCECSLNTK